MAKLWRGPCAALKAAEADPLWAAIHRRAGRLNVFCDVTHDGLTATFFKLENRRGDVYRIELETAHGRDPFSTVLEGIRRLTPLDADLLAQNHAYLERLAEDIVLDGNMIVSKLGRAVDQFV